MTAIALVVLGLCLGSFVNALVWRVHQQETGGDKQSVINNKQKRNSVDDGLSILKGRSMCPNCRQTLKAIDLIPVLSWLSTRGRCRYCAKPISTQYPLVEVATALAFVTSYIWWPRELGAGSWELGVGALWLLIVTGLMALLVYDLKWYILPNRIIYPLTVIAVVLTLIQVSTSDNIPRAVIDTALAVAIGGGLFYVLFQVSDGKWIGGGDVKLGWLLGLVLATPGKAILMIFLAALLGSLVSLPLLLNKKLKKNSIIPFGPFLIIGAFIAMLFGEQIIDWYLHGLLALG